VWLPSIGAIRWGPFFNTVATNVSYRVTGLAGSYPVNGGAWMDGEWYFSPPTTMVTVLSPSPSPSLSPPPQVAPPLFDPGSGSNVPVSLTMTDTTTNAAIYYTLDGSLPTTNSPLYTNALSLTNASTVRAVAFTNGFTPSVAALAYYGPPAATANAQVTRSVDTTYPTAPVVTFSVTPGTNAACVAVTETLPTGLGASNVTAGGTYLASNNMVVWGPFFGTNALVLSYTAVGQPGTYPVQAFWSVDGVGGGETAATNIVVASIFSNGVPTEPPQVSAPVFTPASGSNVPANVTITSATPGAAIYYTLDGSLPTQGSTLYGGPVYLASPSTIRAVAFTNGWTPSVASVAYYGPLSAPANAVVTRSVNTTSPSAPMVTLSVTPGAGASCVAVTEWLPPGVAAASVTAGGHYIASNNVVLWGPFFGSTAQILSYVAVGEPGSYTAQATWSVDGVGGGEAVGTNIVVSYPGPFPTAPTQEPTPMLSPAVGTSLPIVVSIFASDSQAKIYFTTDGTLPTQSSTPYTSELAFTAPTTLRAVAFRAGYTPSVSAVGYYVPALPTNSLSLVRSISGNGTFLPSVTLTATPLGSVNCYAVTETLVPGLTPLGLGADAVWNATNNTISWGPYLDKQPRALTYQLSWPGGTFPLTGQGSFDGHPAAATGATTVWVNPNYLGETTNYLSCTNEPISYTVDINPAPGIITIDTASGTVNWGDGTQSAFTQPFMTLEKVYSSNGTYTITLSATNWTGHTATMPISGTGTKTDTVQVLSTCGWPVISTQPACQTNLAGSEVTFNVAVEGSGPFTYKWQFNGTNLPEDIITTVAGNGIATNGGDGGAATNANLNYPFAVAFDAFNNLYIADSSNNCIRKVATNGIITRVAGNGTPGTNGDGGAATNASLDYPVALAFDGAGNLYFADYYNERIRKVATNGIITTVAGNGTTNFAGDSGQATNASLDGPYGLALDAAGNLYIADRLNNRIRKVATNGIITTVAGNGVETYSGDGGYATNASLNRPLDVAIDPSGNLYIADYYNYVIRKVGTNGMITTVAGNVAAGYSGDGVQATNTSLNRPAGLAFDTIWNLYIADCYNQRIRQVATNGIIITLAGNGTTNFAGDGGAATNASLAYPHRVAFDAAGNLYIADSSNNRIRKVLLYASYPTLSLNDVGAGNAGDYTVVVTSPYGSVTSQVATLIVALPPSVTTQPGNQTVLVGTNVTFTAEVSGPGPMTYQWYFNRTNAIYSPETFAMLTLPNVTLADAGSYSVVVTNAYGSTNSAAAMLTVVAPLVTSGARNGDGSITLHFEGLANTTTRIWAATNLTPPVVWEAIFTNTATGEDGTWQYTDTNATNFSERYYYFTTP
jgi:sugar lactone lactonase YvrE